MSMLDYTEQTTAEFIKLMPKSERKKYGQFFTDKKVASFMASLFSIPEQETIEVLDPGAGAGILSVALIERVQQSTTVRNINLTCYENNLDVIGLLRSNLEWASKNSRVKVKFIIIVDNYIVSQTDDYNCSLYINRNPKKFDLVIGNPPYMKISRDAPEAIAMQDVCYGAPNLYFLFAEMSLFNLKKKGELVYIVPRSWTSGAYFKQFRKKFLTDGALEYIHLFGSRDEVFNAENVLQETIIIKVRKSKDKSDCVTITASEGGTDFSKITKYEVPYSTVVSGEDFYVFLVTNSEEVKALTRLNQWTDTLLSLGLKMKTGLTVDFRNQELLRNVEGKDSVPLFYAQHIREGKVIFPVGKENEYLVIGREGLLQKNENYLFIKRFTSKEERRRLQCGVYLARLYSQYSQISTQNKINFICGTKELSECVVYGLYVLFNSSLYDCYYRMLNGSTQVNATEMNAMPVPPMRIIEEMGKKLIQMKDLSEAVCNNILEAYL